MELREYIDSEIEEIKEEILDGVAVGHYDIGRIDDTQPDEEIISDILGQLDISGQDNLYYVIGQLALLERLKVLYTKG